MHIRCLHAEISSVSPSILVDVCKRWSAIPLPRILLPDFSQPLILGKICRTRQARGFSKNFDSKLRISDAVASRSHTVAVKIEWKLTNGKGCRWGLCEFFHDGK